MKQDYDRSSICDLLLGKTLTEVWRRGEQYAAGGCVEIVTEDARHVDALVKGSQKYHVKISFAANGISRKCDCPYAGGGACKHMVATAIVWDKLRRLNVPSGTEVAAKTIPAPKISQAQISALFKNPLKADLMILRTAADERGGWTRPHSHLPDCPAFPDNPKQALRVEELKNAFREMKKWSRRSAYDPYFCAGEMTAAFCQLLRIAKTRISASDAIVAAHFLLEAQRFHYELVQKLIDDSDGMHKFCTAHLDDFYAALKMIAEEQSLEFNALLTQYTRERNNY